MRKTLLSTFALGLMLWSSPLAAQQLKPLAVFAISSYDELMKDIDYLGELGGQPGASQTLEGLLSLFTQNQGLQGLDKSKPWGGVVQTDGGQFPKAIVLPVTDVKKLLSSLVAFVGEPQDAGDGILEIEIQANRMPLFIKSQDGYAYIGQSKEDLATLPADAAKLIGELAKTYDVGVQAYVQNIPEIFRQLAVGALTQGLEGNLQQGADEDDAAFEERKKFARAQLDAMVTMINDLDTLTVGWSIDRTAKKTFIDFAMTATAGSKTAGQLATSKDATTNFGGFAPADAVFSMNASSKVSDEDAAQGLQSLAAMKGQFVRELEKSTDFPSEEQQKTAIQMVNDGFAMLEGAMKSGKFDLGMGVLGKGPFTFVAGAQVGDNVDKAGLVQKVADMIGQEGQLYEFKKDAAKAGDVSFHRVVVKAPQGEEAEKVAAILGPGNPEIVFGTSKERFYVSLGANAQATLQQCIEKSAATASEKVLPMKLSLALAPVLKLASQAGDAEPAVAMAAGLLEQTGGDKVRMMQQVTDNGVLMRLEAEEGVLKVMGMFAAQARAGRPGGF